MTFDTTKCKCWIRPFEPPKGCFNYCAGRMIRAAKSWELQSVFHISPILADKIFELTSNDKLITLSDFKPFLEDKEYQEIEFKIRNMENSALPWLEEKFKNQIEIEERVPA